MRTKHLPLLLLSVAPFSSHATTVIFEDMSNADNTLLVDNLSNGAGMDEPDFEWNQESVEDVGNPGHGYVATWNYTSTEPYEPLTFGDTFILYSHTDSGWNPSNDGVIGGLVFSIDYKTDNSNFNAINFHIRNNSTGHFTEGTPLITNGSWQTLTFTVNDESELFPTVNTIDFEGNQALRFGFALSGEHPNGFGSGNPASMEITFDNFEVEVIPEPTSAALLLLAGLGGLGIRRRPGRQ